jgi:site-specific DNA recombinase
VLLQREVNQRMAQENTARVITIAAIEQPQDIRLRVAAYARVSSSSDEQLNSFAAQNRYYTELISGKDNWQLVDIYADEGITGTSTEKRDDFKRMLRDCERGLIDRILVKSISRFARNTTECLETVRSLKARGVSVYFEKEGIDTGKVSGEMLTAVFASLAQAESESISKNMRWSYQKRMQMGTYIPSSMPYGYALKNGEITIDPEEADVVRKIYDMYLSGSGKITIAKSLNRREIFNRQHKPWNSSAILYILSNERYIGDSIWQKTYQTNAEHPRQLVS